VYDQELNQSIGMWIGKVTTPGDIERELTNLNKAVIGSFEKACPQRTISGCKKVPWWNPELTLLKKRPTEPLMWHIVLELKMTGYSTEGEARV